MIVNRDLLVRFLPSRGSQLQPHFADRQAQRTSRTQSSECRAFNIAANRAAFCLRRRLALGFSNRFRSRNFFNVCSRSSFFFNRRIARSTGSPFFSLISIIIQF